MLILGIGGWLHDGSAGLIVDGEYVAAIEEEKLLRQKAPWWFSGPGADDLSENRRCPAKGCRTSVLSGKFL